jgi:opacity protein-like surface antigen
MSRVFIRSVLVSGLLLASSAPARADLTVFLGPSFSGSSDITPSGDSRTGLSRGVAVGIGLIIVGFEFEWAQVGGDDGADAFECVADGNCLPTMTTGMANVLLQTPRGISPVQLYATAGAGVYRERYEWVDEVGTGGSRSDTNVGTNLGGGVKISVLGPLRVRIDYRVFKLSGDALYSTPQRLYVGANLAF